MPLGTGRSQMPRKKKGYFVMGKNPNATYENVTNVP